VSILIAKEFQFQGANGFRASARMAKQIQPHRVGSADKIKFIISPSANAGRSPNLFCAPGWNPAAINGNRNKKAGRLQLHLATHLPDSPAGEQRS